MDSKVPLSEDYAFDLMDYLNYDEKLEWLFNSSDFNHSMEFYIDDIDTDQLINSVTSFINDNPQSSEPPEPMTYALIVLYTTSFLFGLMGNVMALCVVYRCRFFNQTTTLLLGSLLVSNLLVVTVCLPFTMVTHVHGEWLHGKVTCKLLPFIQGTSVFSGMFMLFILTVQQTCGKSHPSTVRRVLKGYRTVLIVLVAWAAALLLSSPLLYVSELKVLEIMGLMTVKMCQEVWPHERSRHLYNVIIFLTTYVIPYVIFSVSYARRMLGRKSRDREEHQLNDRQPQTTENNAGEDRKDSTEDSTKNDVINEQTITQKRGNAQRLVVCLAVLFAVLWLPYHVIIIYLDLHVEDKTVTSLGAHIFPVVQWLALSNAAFHPVCFCLLAPDYRRVLLQACLCKASSQTSCSEEGLFVQDGLFGPTSQCNSHFEEDSWATDDDSNEVVDVVTVL